MKNEADRIRRWRERQKAEGKTSFTVLLSQEARDFLAEEKAKTGDCYAVIVEKALQTLKKQGYRPPVLKHFPKREGVLTKAVTQETSALNSSVTSYENGAQTRILIDDLANYPTLEDIERERAGKEQDVRYDIKSNEGLITRLLRSSTGRRRKWFK
ncbi:MAG TPA: hypothetical protein VMB77_13810 [Syntrophales bacterium]|nr:hypothetical protein [Syntrophales bacterium]